VKPPAFNKGDQSRGFTLLEVMVAVAILGLVVTGIMYVFSNALKGIGKTELYTEGVLVAREAMERTLIQPFLEEGISSGTFNDVFQWEVSILLRETAVESDTLDLAEAAGVTLPIDWMQEESPLRLYEVVVDVTWPDTGYPGHVSLRTLSARVELPDTLTVMEG
jgi:prepilin-type N-terminal cleavage/methylation domain-containing protein